MARAPGCVRPEPAELPSGGALAAEARSPLLSRREGGPGGAGDRPARRTACSTAGRAGTRAVPAPTGLPPPPPLLPPCHSAPLPTRPAQPSSAVPAHSYGLKVSGSLNPCLPTATPAGGGAFGAVWVTPGQERHPRHSPGGLRTGHPHPHPEGDPSQCSSTPLCLRGCPLGTAARRHGDACQGPVPPSLRLAADLTTSKTRAPRVPRPPTWDSKQGPGREGWGRRGWPGRAGCVQGNGAERPPGWALTYRARPSLGTAAAKALGADGSGFG